MDPLIGTQLGQYQIIEAIGRGGMSVIYRGLQPALERTVAIKVLSAALTHDPAFVQRFRREALSAARLNHPNIVTIYDVGQQGETHYIAMEFLQGESLDKILRRGPMPLERALPILDQVASALDYAHENGLVHRDIKPSNVIVDSRDRATLTDFGIAKAREETTGLTQAGTIIGTPQYMAPEQIQGQMVDHRADIYALGIMVYEMLAGKVPFTGDTGAILYAQVVTPAPTLRAWNPTLPAHVEAAVARALAKNPAQRWQSAGDFVAALRGKTVSDSVQAGARTPVPATLPLPSAPTPDDVARANQPTAVLPQSYQQGHPSPPSPYQQLPAPQYQASQPSYQAAPPPAAPQPYRPAPSPYPAAPPPPVAAKGRGFPWLPLAAFLLCLFVGGAGALLGLNRRNATASATPTSEIVVVPGDATATTVAPADATTTAETPPSEAPTATSPLASAPTATAEVAPSATPSRAEREAAAIATLPLRSGRGDVAFAYPALSPPTIDGNLDDWNEETFYPIQSVVFKPENVSGPADSSGSYAVRWDISTLYIAVDVTDDALVQTQEGATSFQGDGVELLVDANRAGDFDGASLSDDDFQIVLIPTNLTGTDTSAYRWFPRAREADLSSQVGVVGASTSTGYRIEAAIPWGVLGLSGNVPPDAIGLVVSLNDNDAPGTAAQESLVSSSPVRKLTDPTTWGTMVLMRDP